TCALPISLARLGLLQPQQLRARELLDLPALRADQVLPHGLLPEQMLVALEALAEIVFRDQATLHQHLERAIDRRLADPLALLTQPGLDVLDGQVLRTREDDLRSEARRVGK